MSCVLSEEHSFGWPVTIRVPSDDGAFKEQKLRVRFLTLSQDEFAAAISDQQFADHELLSRALKGWDGVVDADNQPVIFDEENKARLLSLPFARIALAEAFMEAMSGQKARRKN